LRGSGWRGAVSFSRFGLRPNEVDPDGNTFLQFNLSNGDCSVWAIEHTLNQAFLRDAGTVCKLWHPRGKLVGNPRSQKDIWLGELNG